MHTKFWSENLKGKRPAGRAKRRWKDNFRKDLGELGSEVVDCIHLAQDREPVAGSCEH
jgi:hypothetical protein